MFSCYDYNQIHPLYHVGTMDLSKKQNYSLEWNNLSVSICPDAWRRITEGMTHGKTWKLEKANAKFLDYYALTEKEKTLIQEWAIRENYVEEKTLYKAISYDEDGTEIYRLYENYEEALIEVYNEIENVKEQKGFIPTNKLKDISLVNIELLNIRDIMAQLYAEKVLHYDGVYWDEQLDIYSYSAPRGCVFNSRLKTFNITEETRNM